MTTQDEPTRPPIEQTGCGKTQAIEALHKTGNDLIDAIVHLDCGHIHRRTLIDGEDFVQCDGHIISTVLSQSNDSCLREKGIRMDQYLSNMTLRIDPRPFDERLKEELRRLGITPSQSRI